MINDKYEYIIYHVKKASYYLDLVTEDLIKNDFNKFKKYLIASEFHELLISYQLKNPILLNLNYKQIYDLAIKMIDSQIFVFLGGTDSVLDELVKETSCYAAKYKICLNVIYDKVKFIKK